MAAKTPGGSKGRRSAEAAGRKSPGSAKRRGRGATDGAGSGKGRANGSAGERKARARPGGKKGRGKSLADDEPKALAVESAPEPDGSQVDTSSDLLSRLFGTWASVFSAAATVAERELAFGIKVAEFVERRLLNVDELRSDGADDLVGRWRRDAHNVLDMMVDVVHVSVNSLTGQAGSVLGVKAEAQKTAGGSSGEHFVIVRMPGPLAPGHTGERVLQLHNDGENTAPCAPRCSDLVNASGAGIEADHVYFDPPQLSVGRGETGELVVGVTVPEGTPGGRYEGLLQGLPGNAARTLLQVKVR